MAKKQKQENEVTATRNVTKCLPCKLTEEEILQYGKDIARANAELDRINNEFSSIKSDYKFKADEQSATIGKLCSRVHSGEEMRDVECVQVMNYTTATVSVTRSDTGEVIESRPMREDEKQTQLNIEQPAS